MQNKKTLLVIGQFSLVFGIVSFILNYFLFNMQLTLFIFSGVLFGISLVFNLTYLLRLKKQNNL